MQPATPGAGACERCCQRHQICLPRSRQVLVPVRAQPQQEATHWQPVPGRREALLSAGLAAVLLPIQAAHAEEPLQPFDDELDGFSIAVPSGWSKAKGDAVGKKNKFAVPSSRRALSWFPEGDPTLSTNVTVVVTGVGPDYTSLGSFGTAEQFGDNLVASMDRSYQLRAPAFGSRPAGSVQEARLIGAKETSKMYYVEYTFRKPSEQERHLVSLVALGNNGRVNRLYTLTAQCYESHFSQQKDLFAGILKTFKPPSRRL
ncbi:hypothetical protein WJX84_001021 [Apatococcus fuscideae]|uniref:PsbP C-terminal domain-containing protein n=1 Tax=Apatococcus fuscideae TaxID=2026836 RepID=A0AAW1TI97_9CHLO